MRLAAQDITQICTASIRQRGKAKVFTAVNTDTRALRKDALFVALSGENFDAHQFLNQAWQAGAAGTIVKKGKRISIKPGRWVFRVEEPLTALGDIAHYWRQQHKIPIVAVTGSNGKTTTKEFIAQILAHQWNTLKTEGNYNNLVGVPWTLFRLQKKHQAAVIEMGMNALGEIDRLAAITAPQVGVITNVARAHLEGLGSVQHVARAKGELLRHIANDGVAILNADDPHSKALIKRARGQVITYGFSPKAKVRGTAFKNQGFRSCSFRVTLKGKSHLFKLPLPGQYNATNALAAIAVGHYFGMKAIEMKQALATVELPGGRLDRRRLKNGTMIINDSYNANPDSVQQALSILASVPQRTRKIVILGDMLELGRSSRQAHREIGRNAGRLKPKHLIAVGDWAHEIAHGAKQAGLDATRIHTCADAMAARPIVKAQVKTGDLIFLKGSRGVKLETIIPVITKQRAA